MQKLNLLSRNGKGSFFVCSQIDKGFIAFRFSAAFPHGFGNEKYCQQWSEIRPSCLYCDKYLSIKRHFPVI